MVKIENRPKKLVVKRVEGNWSALSGAYATMKCLSQSDLSDARTLLCHLSLLCSVLITVQRPPSHFTLTLLNSGTAPPHTSSSPPLPARSPTHNTSPPPSDMPPNIPPPQHESEKPATDRETGGATASTVLDTQAEGVRKRKAGQRGLETKGSLSASQLPMDSFDGKHVNLYLVNVGEFLRKRSLSHVRWGRGVTPTDFMYYKATVSL